MELKQFLENSPLAEKIKLESRVVVHRSRMSTNDVQAIREQASLGPIEHKDTTCELEIAGQVIARGRIVRRGGAYYFRVTGMKDKEAANGK